MASPAPLAFASRREWRCSPSARSGRRLAGYFAAFGSDACASIWTRPSPVYGADAIRSLAASPWAVVTHTAVRWTFAAAVLPLRGWP